MPHDTHPQKNNIPEMISIITPAFNCVDTFKQTFESVISQTYQSWEWIIIDDNSTDGSYDYIRKIAQNEPRVILLKNESNAGAAATRNKGIKLSQGRFIAFIDADDMWEKSKLEKQIDFMRQNDYEFSYSDYNVLFSDGSIKKYVKGKNDLTYKNLLAGNDIGCLTVIYDVSKIGKRYMPEDCPKREDYACWLDITKEGILAHKLGLVLATYRLRHGSVSSNKLKMMRYHLNVYRNHEKLSLPKSLYYLTRTVFNRLVKYN